MTLRPGLTFAKEQAVDGVSTFFSGCTANKIKGYMAVVNKHYKENGHNEPWDAEGDSDAAVLVQSQSRFEKMPAKRDSLTRPMIVKMCELSKEGPLGIKA